MTPESTQTVAILAPRSTIGQALSKRLQSAGAGIAFIGRDLNGVETDTTAFLRECPLTDFDAVETALGEARAELGSLTGIVNCAGSMLLKPAHATTRAEFDGLIESNLSTAFAAVRASARHIGPGGGSVVLISSAAATLGMPNHEGIAAAKSAVEGLVRSAAASYASKGIRFNAVAPGLVVSNLSQRLVSNETSRTISESLHPLGRIGEPEDIASAIAWLLHSDQSWMTGQVVGVDGGLSRVQPKPKLAAPRR